VPFQFLGACAAAALAAAALAAASALAWRYFSLSAVQSLEWGFSGTSNSAVRP
jgi:hypothetical protein